MTAVPLWAWGVTLAVLAVLIVAGVAYTTLSRSDTTDAVMEQALADEPA